VVGVSERLFPLGVPFGRVVEFGAPMGMDGREVLLRLISEMTTLKQWALWVNCYSEWSALPSAWFARGVQPEYLVFAESQRPMSDLKPVFLSPFFKCMVIDCSDVRLKVGDFAFLSHQARQFNQLIIVIRNYYLSNSYGNIWTPFRFNIFRSSSGFRIDCIRPRYSSFNL